MNIWKIKNWRTLLFLKTHNFQFNHEKLRNKYHKCFFPVNKQMDMFVNQIAVSDKRIPEKAMQIILISKFCHILVKKTIHLKFFQFRWKKSKDVRINQWMCRKRNQVKFEVLFSLLIRKKFLWVLDLYLALHGLELLTTGTRKCCYLCRTLLWYVLQGRSGRSHIFRLRHRSCSEILNPDPVPSKISDLSEFSDLLGILFVVL